MKNLIVRYLFSTILSIAISLAANAQKAAFTPSDSVGCVPFTVNFTNNSTGATSYRWDFGNGNTSTQQKPSNVYTKPGLYSVKLIAYSSSGKDSVIYKNLLKVVPNPVAAFSAKDSMGCPGVTISFSNNSLNSTTYAWDFGDGSASALANPSHTYSTSGNYTVKLIAYNSYGCKSVVTRTKFVTIYNSPVVSFAPAATYVCDTTNSLAFNDKTSGAVSWLWCFGDSSTSTIQKPSHRYSKPGFYSARLSVTNTNGCTGSAYLANALFVDSIVKVKFSTATPSGCVPLNATFSTSYPNLKSLAWDFGDGGTSTAVNPKHNFNSAGKYTISLDVVTTKGCKRSGSITDYISVTQKPTGAFSVGKSKVCRYESISFTNNSTGASTWLWEFGDGGKSTLKEPKHYYTKDGIFNIRLHSYSTSGCEDIYDMKAAVQVSSAAANFTSANNTGCPGLNVSFKDSSGSATSWSWNFGDTTTSTLQNPSHTYKYVGNFNVTLIAKNAVGCTDTLKKVNYVSIANLPNSYVAPAVTTGCVPFSPVLADPGTGSTSWFWDFGDGTTSTDKIPSHTYNFKGKYTVSLSVTKAGGCTLKYNPFKTFDVSGAVAAFKWKQTTCPPFTVEFSDTSANNVTGWLWNFGDGTTSYLKNPKHIYAKAGTFSSSLTVTTQSGCSHTEYKPKNVTFIPFSASIGTVIIGTKFPKTVKFKSNAVNVTSYTWDFGDSSALDYTANPTHIYKLDTSYKVRLTVSNAICTLNLATILFNKIIPPPPTGGGGNSKGGGPVYYPEVNCAPVSVSFTDTMKNVSTRLWVFGDGDSSTLENVRHKYTKNGDFDVKLYHVYNNKTIDSVIMTSYVKVVGPEAKYKIEQKTSCSNTILNFRDSSAYARKYSWDFGDGTAADTNHVPAPHTYPTDDKIYTVKLTVSDSFGCTMAYSKNIFAGFANPISVSKKDACWSDTINFTSVFNNYAYYAWDFGDGNTSIQPSPSHQYVNAGSYTVKLTVTDSLRCVKTYSYGSKIIVTKPAVNFSADSTRGCAKINTHFYNATTGATTYVWDFGDGATGTSWSPVHTYKNLGLYDVTLKATIKGCSASLTKPSFIRLQTPVVKFSTIQDKSCFPITVNFTDSSERAASWQWNFGDGGTSTLQNPTHIFKTLPANLTTLTIRDSNGCVGSMTKPGVHFLKAKFSTASNRGCAPWNVQFKDQSSDAVSWFWAFGDGDTSTSAIPAHIYKTAGNFDVTLVVKSNGGCVDTLTMKSFLHTSKPVSRFYSPDKAACAPSVVNFIDSSYDATAWAWDFGDGGNSAKQNPSHIYGEPGTYTVKLTVKNTYGCLDSVVRTNYVKVLGPTSIFTASDTLVCGKARVIFADKSKSAVSWSWNFGDGTNTTDQNPAHDYLNTGSYYVSLITKDAYGCTSLYTLPQRVRIEDKPAAGFKMQANGVCQPVSLQLTDTSKGADSYTWNFGDGKTSLLKNPSHLYDSAGTFSGYLVAKNKQGCTDTARFANGILVNPKPEAIMDADMTKGCPPLKVSFRGTELGKNGFQCSWDFGNGQTSKLQNPQMVYAKPGRYTVSMIAFNNYGCTDTVHNKEYIEVFDIKLPRASDVFTATVENNTNVKLIWDSCKGRSFSAYNIYRKNPKTMLFEKIKTITDRKITTFMDAGLNTLSASYGYKVQTVDYCGNALPLDSLRPYYTMNVTAKAEKANIRVNWTSYGGCDVYQYEIYRTTVGTLDSVLVASVSPSETSFLDNTFICPLQYSYHIKATVLCGRPYASWSDTSIAQPENLLKYQRVDATRSTVLNDSVVYTEWKAPEVAPDKVGGYKIYRSENNGAFTAIADVPAQVYYFMDSKVDVQHKTYTYRIDVNSGCNVPVLAGQKGVSILLKANKEKNADVVNVWWTPYTEWKEGVKTYIIEKQKEDGTWEEVQKVDGKTLRIQDGR